MIVTKRFCSQCVGPHPLPCFVHPNDPGHDLLCVDVPDPPPITPNDIERIKAEGKEWAAVVKRAADAMRPSNFRPRQPLVTDPKTELKKRGTCVVCQGDVVQKITYQYRGSRRVGYDAKRPELRTPYNTNTIYSNHYCVKCGIRYEFPPNAVSDDDENDDTPQPE